MEEKNEKEKETLRKELATTTKNLDLKLKEMEENNPIAKKKIEDLQRDLETKTNENENLKNTIELQKKDFELKEMPQDKDKEKSLSKRDGRKK